jgi:hypothetical protein
MSIRAFLVLSGERLFTFELVVRASKVAAIESWTALYPPPI